MNTLMEKKDLAGGGNWSLPGDLKQKVQKYS